MTAENLPPIDPIEQLSLASKINALCDVEQVFNPQTQVEDAQQIVRALARRIEPGEAAITVIARPGKNKSIRGATEQGEVNVSTQQDQNKIWKSGKVDEYKIGAYVVTQKNVRGKRAKMSFEHFWGRSEELIKGPQVKTYIRYKRETLEVTEIGRIQPRWMVISNVRLVTFRNRPLWKKN